MTLHVSIIGIDGSGKSTVATALPHILAAEMKVLAGAAGDDFRIVDADQDHLLPGFRPVGLPLIGHLSRWSKRLAKRAVDNRRLYPFFKACQMIFQDATAYTLGRRYGAALMISDGNVLLSTMGRIANYISPASTGADIGRLEPDASDLKAVFEYLCDGKPLSRETQAKLPDLRKAARVQRLIRRFGLHAGWLPDVVIFLDISPETAMKRIADRGKKVDLHENLDDLAQARKMYLKTADAFALYRSSHVAHRIAADNMTPGEALRAAVKALAPYELAIRREKTEKKLPLGTTKAQVSGVAVWRRLLNPRYSFGYLAGHWFRGAWREPTFFFSGLGSLLRREGYSANMMRAIYDQDIKRHGFLDRVFLNYSLHRAVHDRLHILTGNIEAELGKRLAEGRMLGIFTAPSGYAYDLFQPLKSIAARSPAAINTMHLVAADLDPYENLARELASEARNLGLRFAFLRGDITDDGMRDRFAQAGPYDVVLFVGLSAWLPKPQLLSHFRWIRQNIRRDGILVSDCFTPASYAISGWHFGYKANYYTPEVYRAMADYCGFDGFGARCESVQNKMNHVLLFLPSDSGNS
ncbi:MAG: hypothetical protein HY667_01015 [Chloroflexi bacterium]|nr:hypothetical protein [Chloroflexota bacterium]